MQNTGIARLPLHYGKAPRWLVSRMQNLAREIATIMINEHGTDAFLRRISDPFWFQALGCVLGYDWHSSGVTTVLTGVLKCAVTPDLHGLAVCGGKGNASRRTPFEIVEASEKLGLSSKETQILSYASRMSAKVDNAAIQAGYHLYHHAFIVTERGKWAVVQQGMNPADRVARRYHWLSESASSLVVEPHNAVVCDRKHDMVLDMTARDSEACRKTSVDLVKEPPAKLMRLVLPPKHANQRLLQEWLPTSAKASGMRTVSVLSMPQNINWKALQQVYEFQPQNYEELLAFRGVGPATVRGLALIAELIYGNKPSWKDPVKYSFAYGGKDGVPYPVDRKAMDESIQILRQAVEEAKIGGKQKMRSLQKLRQFVPPNMIN